MHSSSLAKGEQYNNPMSEKDIQQFINDYGVNVDEIELPLTSYKTLNEFFSRKLKDGARAIYEEKDVQAVVSPADGRVYAWETVELAKKISIKGRDFTVPLLVGGAAATKAGIDVAEYGKGGSLMIFRLAPTDYHRFHAPFDCVISKVVKIPGDLFSVKTYCVNSRVNILTDNYREVLFLKSPVFGEVAYVIVGATYVGSITLTAAEGQELKAGQEIGYFQYGGSTVVLAFKHDSRVRFDADLVARSDKKHETLVKLGERVGIKVAAAAAPSTV